MLPPQNEDHMPPRKGSRRMRPLVCLAHMLFGLAFTMQGCGRDQPVPPAGGKALAQAPRVGKLAPEIEGEDVDGVPFKLSDYRGKVVLLDFWGHW